jgi:hypothetical protein
MRHLTRMPIIVALVVLVMPACTEQWPSGTEAMLYRDPSQSARYVGVPEDDVGIFTGTGNASAEEAIEFAKVGTRVRVIDDLVEHPLARGRRLLRVRVCEGPHADVIGAVDRDDLRILPLSR